ncbi:MAG: PSD1 and planctomycete cytochrome C domain-containing protein [Bryobacteraceae bacterium]
MSYLKAIGVIGMMLAMIPVGRAAPVSNEQSEFFESRIRPLFATNCYSCHTSAKLGGLRLDSAEALSNGSKSGPVVVPGKPEESILIQRVKDKDPKRRMPMGGSLSDREVQDLEKWVSMGAAWPEAPKSPAFSSKDSGKTLEQKAFWSFQPIRKVEPPKVSDTAWVRSPIDAFVLAKLESKGMRPARPATKQEFIRRATFDLTGLPPTPKEIDDFVGDTSPQSYTKLIDRLLASPHYGERWGRHWLDVARYGEDDVRGAVPAGYEPYDNAFRYRDWVIQSFNEDMPYDLFVKAQLAADLLNRPDKNQLMAGLGLLGLGPWYFDLADAPQARANERHDRVDVVTRGFLGLTGACARCHDHKYDPISTKDYYALAGVFASTEYREYPLVPDAVVQDYKAKEKQVKDKEGSIKEYLNSQSQQLAEAMALETAKYMFAAWRLLGPSKSDIAKEAKTEQVDKETLERWVSYLGQQKRDHGYLNEWDALLLKGGTDAEAHNVAARFQIQVLAVLEEKKAIDSNNQRVLSAAKQKRGAPFAYLPNGFALYDGDTDNCFGVSVVVKSLDREEYILWSEIAGERQVLNRAKKEPGLFLYKDEQLERFLDNERKSYIRAQNADLEALKKALPVRYPYLQIVGESSRIGNLKVHLRGSPYNLGEEVPRRFIAVLTPAVARPFTHGSGRLELADLIASHPLAARVMVNRIWQHHFGRGIVGTPSNFGVMGDRPSEPELLEYLSARFIENGYSIKQMHREMMLSSTYQLSTGFSATNFEQDPDNRLFWRANRQRLDGETIRDTLLFVAGDLDAKVGGPSQDLSLTNTRRSVYGKISRFKLDPFLALFDFPDPGVTSELRNVTSVPSQGLFFLNSPLVMQCAEHLTSRLSREVGTDARARIPYAYRLLYGRDVTGSELEVGQEFLRSNPGASSWQQYLQALLSANEFLFLN